MNLLRRPLRLFAITLGALVLLSAASTLAAANSVPKSGAGQSITSISMIDDLVPAACSGINLKHGITGNGVLNGTSQPDMIVGGAGADTISGANQRDCLLGGDGNDDISGDAGADVLFGGYGDDTLNGGAGADVMYGGPGNDTIYGDGGGDTIDGGPGFDYCYGLGGTDTFVNCEFIQQ